MVNGGQTITFDIYITLVYLQANIYEYKILGQSPEISSNIPAKKDLLKVVVTNYRDKARSGQ